MLSALRAATSALTAAPALSGTSLLQVGCLSALSTSPAARAALTGTAQARHITPSTSSQQHSAKRAAEDSARLHTTRGVSISPSVSAPSMTTTCGCGTPRTFATDTRPPGSNKGQKKGQEWTVLAGSGAKINPCNSPLHPAVQAAGILPEPDAPVLSVQEAYDPASTCFGCGPSSKEGLGLRSFRFAHAGKLGGLEARITMDSKYLAFPGVVSGGVLTTLIQCHGNWTAAITLMDLGHLSKPPLTMTKSVLVSYKEPTPPGEELLVESEVMGIRADGSTRGGPTVEVDITIYQVDKMSGEKKVLVTSSGLFKRLGGARSL